MATKLTMREARADDVPGMTAFILEHGPNQWNYLPEEEVASHIAAIAGGKICAVIAEDDAQLIGFVTFMTSRSMYRYQPRERLGYPHGYVGEAVVQRDYAGQGIGTRLLQEAVARLGAQGHREVYIERHEENRASAGMMRKAGFVEVATHDDPQRRSFGSRRTTVCRFVFDR